MSHVNIREGGLSFVRIASVDAADLPKSMEAESESDFLRHRGRDAFRKDALFSSDNDSKQMERDVQSLDKST